MVATFYDSGFNSPYCVIRIYELVFNEVFWQFLFILGMLFVYGIKIKILNIFFVLTFLFAYVFMPDSDDISSYVFFGLVHNENVLNIAEIISTVAFVGNVVTFIMQIIGIEKI